LLVAVLVPAALGGAGDTLDQVKVAFSNVAVGDQALHEAVTVRSGSLPTWLEGSLVRHACGVFGNVDTNTTMIDTIDHLFDCITMLQSYHFHDGKATYSNQFLDTNQLQVWKKYNEDMRQSSLWFETVYSNQNITAMEKEEEDMTQLDRPYSTAHVSWWTLGDKAVAFGEYINGASMDVHNNKYIGNFLLKPSLWEGWSAVNVPAHEQTDENGMVWTVVAVVKAGESGNLHQKRVIIKIDPTTMNQTAEGEYSYPDVDFQLCKQGEVYPDPATRFGYMHAIQLTKKYIILPETSYLNDPCSTIHYDNNLGRYDQSYTYEPTVKSNVYLMDRTTKEVTKIPIDPMFATHSMGAFEDDTTGNIYFDMMTYANADIYTKWTYRQHAVSNEDYPNDLTRLVRYTIDRNLHWRGLKSLIKSPDADVGTKAFEFPSMNPAYHGKPYKYIYTIQNPFKRFGALIKLNVETGIVTRKEMPDGYFPTEPIFVAAPDATNEDDGVVVVGGINGKDKVGFILAFNASNMEMIYQADAPKLTLFGLHAHFYPFTKGCSEDDCTPSSSTSLSASLMLSFVGVLGLLRTWVGSFGTIQL